MSSEHSFWMTPKRDKQKCTLKPNSSIFLLDNEKELLYKRETCTATQLPQHPTTCDTGKGTHGRVSTQERKICPIHIRASCETPGSYHTPVGLRLEHFRVGTRPLSLDFSSDVTVLANEHLRYLVRADADTLAVEPTVAVIAIQHESKHLHDVKNMTQQWRERLKITGTKVYAALQGVTFFLYKDVALRRRESTFGIMLGLMLAHLTWDQRWQSSQSMNLMQKIKWWEQCERHLLIEITILHRKWVGRNVKLSKKQKWLTKKQKPPASWHKKAKQKQKFSHSFWNKAHARSECENQQTQTSSALLKPSSDKNVHTKELCWSDCLQDETLRHPIRVQYGWRIAGTWEVWYTEMGTISPSASTWMTKQAQEHLSQEHLSALTCSNNEKNQHTRCWRHDCKYTSHPHHRCRVERPCLPESKPEQNIVKWQ